MSLLGVDLSAEWIVAGATVVNTIILVAAATYAAAQVKATREATEAQMRPWVMADFDFMSRPPIISIYVENFGRTPAKDIVLSFDPPLRSSFDDASGKVAAQGFLARPLETLAPGKRIETIFDNGRLRSKANLEDIYKVTISYKGLPPGATKETEYTETHVLDIGVLWGMQYVMPRGLADIHSQLEELKKIFARWSAPGVAQGSGIVVKTPDDLARQAEEDRRYFEQLRARRKSAEEE